MNCLHCGLECQPDFAFCPKCGARLPANASTSPAGAFDGSGRADADLRPKTIPVTSAALDERIRRLIPPGYAERLAAAQGQAIHERRTVTILFCDVAGSTALAEHLDPEDALDIMNGAFEAIIPPVYRQEGTLARLMGDAILAFFGAPVAHEDDPLRAVRAGLEIIAAARAYADRLAAERGISDFAVRVGIHTGLVVVGEVGSDLRMEYTAIGDAVNLAARMEQAAPRWGILITHDTFQHVRGRFAAAPQPPLAVKGRQASVRTYVVERALPEAFKAPGRGVEGIEAPLVGREAELAALQAAYRSAVTNAARRTVVVTGESGVGKSRLVEEFVAWAQGWAGDDGEKLVEGDLEGLSPPLCMRGRAAVATQGIPFGLLRDLFAREFDIRDSDSAAEAMIKFRAGVAATLDPDEADVAGQLVGFDFSVSAAVRSLWGSPSFGQLAAAYLIRYFRDLAKAPLIIVLDDLHWADDSSLDFVERLAVELSGARLLIVAAARSDFAQRRPKWRAASGWCECLELRALTAEDGRALALQLLRLMPEDAQTLCDLLVDRADGNPYYMEELIRMLLEDGAIEATAGRWRLNSSRMQQIRVPPTLTGVLQARMDALNPEEKLLVQRASVCGRHFWDTLAAELAPEAAPVAPLLAALEGRGLVAALVGSAFEDATEYAFKHHLVRDAAYESVLLKVRRACHGQVARWLERHAGERLGEYLALAADHYRLAGEGAVAADRYLRAGERAAAQGAHAEGRSLLTLALDLLPVEDWSKRWRALAARNEVLGVLGDLAARREDDAALLALARAAGDDIWLAEAFFRHARSWELAGQFQQAIEATDAGLAAALHGGASAMEAKVLAYKVFLLTRLGKIEDAGAIASRALAAADATGDPEILARGLVNISVYYTAVGDLAQSALLLIRQVEINRRQGNRFGEALGMVNLGYNYLRLGLYLEARKTLEQALSLSTALAARQQRLYAMINLGLASWRGGDGAAAQHLLEDAIPELGALGDSFGCAAAKTYLGMVLEGGEDVARGCALLTEAAGTMEKIGAQGYAIDAQATLARYALRQGDHTAARERAHAVYDYLSGSSGSRAMEFPLMAYYTCIVVFRELGEREKAEAAVTDGFALLRAQAARISDPGWQRLYLENVPEHRALVAWRHPAA